MKEPSWRTRAVAIIKELLEYVLVLLIVLLIFTLAAATLGPGLGNLLQPRNDNATLAVPTFAPGATDPFNPRNPLWATLTQVAQLTPPASATPTPLVTPTATPAVTEEVAS